MRTTGYTEALKNGDIKIPGIEFDFVEVKPQIAAFRRMIRGLEFDICELASTTYMVAKGFNKPFKALPTFFNRRFHHHSILVDPKVIKQPKDLEGKKFGVRAYSVTTGVWTRGVLQNEYGVDPFKVTWVVDDEDHVTELKLPPNVERAPAGKSLAQMLVDGEIQAGMTGNAGLGRAGAPTADWDNQKLPDLSAYPELIQNHEEVEKAWYKRTGIYPVHPTIVIKDEVAKANPDLPRKLFDALMESKNRYVAKLHAGQATEKGDKALLKLTEIVGPDPLPYGLEVNRPAIEALMKYAEQQKLVPGPLKLNDVFYDFN
jgi:4,5-dihydroxyphthalate decarboxylase